MKLPKCFYSKGANTKIAITLVNAKLRANDRKLRDLCRPGKINDQRKIDKFRRYTVHTKGNVKQLMDDS